MAGTKVKEQRKRKDRETNGSSSTASAAGSKSRASSAAGASASATPAAAIPAPIPLGARTGRRWVAAQQATREGRRAINKRNMVAESEAAMRKLSTLDQDEDENDDEAEIDEDEEDDGETEELNIEDADDDEEDADDDADGADDEDEDEDDSEEVDDDSDDEDFDINDESDSLDDSDSGDSVDARRKSPKKGQAKANANGNSASPVSKKKPKSKTASKKRTAPAAAASTDDDDLSGDDSPRIPSAADYAANNPHAPSVEEDGIDESEDDEEFTGNLAEGSDSSADEGEDGRSIKYRNRIGNVPFEWYNDYDHIGYDVSGKKIVKSIKGDKLEQLLQRMDDPNWDRTVYDPVNDVSVVLTNDELDMITRLRKGQYAHASFNPSNPEYTIDSFTEDIRHEVIGQSIEPKRRFIPSKWEAKTILKYVTAMRNGWMKLPEDIEAERAAKKAPTLFLLWGEDGTAIEDPKTASHTPHRMPARIGAPKPPLPGHAESYNPPREYLMTEEEKEEWERMDPSDRPMNFIPQAYDAMRKIPAYENFVKERFERCLDLYLCPRAKVKKLRNVDPASLIPTLPKPADLRPFPTTLTIEYRGHRGLIRSISLSPDGQWLASGSDDGTVRIFEVSTGRCYRKWDFKNQHTEDDDSIVVECVAFNPNPAMPLLAVAVGTHIFLLHTHIITNGTEKNKVQELIKQPALEQQPIDRTQQTEKQIRQAKACTWKVLDELISESAEGEPHEPDTSLVATESLLKKPPTNVDYTEQPPPVTKSSGWSVLAIDCSLRVKHINWHSKGDYFSSVSTVGTDTSSVLIHRLSQHQTQSPFAKSKGLVMAVHFHPQKPFLFVMTKRHIRIYNLVQQSLVKKLLCPAKWLSSLSIHPGGDHVLAGSYDRKVCWYDLDLSSKPYKTLKYHSKAVRNVVFHPKAPLFATCSDDGALHIFHGRVYEDLTTDPLIVPVKIIQAHTPVKDIGVLHCTFHPTEPWIFSSGADQVIRLFTC